MSVTLTVNEASVMKLNKKKRKKKQWKNLYNVYIFMNSRQEREETCIMDIFEGNTLTW
jgi:TFIIF-interacting CTD phosphatase-like protein